MPTQDPLAIAAMLLGGHPAVRSEAALRAALRLFRATKDGHALLLSQHRIDCFLALRMDAPLPPEPSPSVPPKTLLFGEAATRLGWGKRKLRRVIAASRACDALDRRDFEGTAALQIDGVTQ
jgi:hypothetical protein